MNITISDEILNSTGQGIVKLSQCYTKGAYSVECLYDTICPQLNRHFINSGIVLIVLNILVSWLLWWFVNYGYKKINVPITKKFGSMENDFNRLLLDSWIRARLTSLNIAYIAMVVWLSINQKI